MGPIIALFNFCVRQTLLSRKIWMTLLILAAPCALLLVIRNFAPPVTKAGTLWEMYHVPAHFLLMSLLVPLVCMVHGTALIGADVEARTITYLTTRRMHRATVLLVKFLAAGLVLVVLCDLTMVGIHFCVLAGRDVPALLPHSNYADWEPVSDLVGYLTTIPLGVLGFLAIFSLIGLLAARPIAVSVVYLVAVELILSSIPARAKVYSLSHHLRVRMSGMMPHVADLYKLPPDLRDELYPQGASALPELFGVIVITLTVSAVLMTVRELVPAKVSRE